MHLKTEIKPRAPFDAADPINRVYTIAFQLFVFLAAFVIVISRRPDAIFNAQFYAEDGLVWFLDAYNKGIHSLLMQQGSYLHIFKRLVALASLLIPFSRVPLLMNLCGIVVQILPVNVFLSSRFSQIPIRLRLLASFIYLALPNSYEINVTITNVQWHLALLACVVLLARPAISTGWRIFDGFALVLTSLDGPMALVLLPVAAALWWLRRNASARTNFAFLIPGTVIQVFSILLTWQSRQIAPNGASINRLFTILYRQFFFPALLGLKASRLLGEGPLSPIEVIATLVGLALLLYALRYAPIELKLFIAYAFGVFALSLARPLAGSLDRPQWAWLCIPGAGNRYYFLPMLSFLAVLLWIAVDESHRKLRYLGIALLLLLPVGIYRDWSYPEYKDLDFKKYAAEFEHAPSGARMRIPLNPTDDWVMEITKH